MTDLHGTCVKDLTRNMVKQLLDRAIKLLVGDLWLLNCLHDADAGVLIECDQELRQLAPPEAKSVQVVSPRRSLTLTFTEAGSNEKKVGDLLEAVQVNPRQELDLLERIWGAKEPTVLVNNHNHRVLFGNESSAIDAYKGSTLEQWTSRYAEISPLWRGYEQELENNLTFLKRGETMTHCTYKAWHLQGFRASFEATWAPKQWFRMSCRMVTMHGYTSLNEYHSGDQPE